MNYVSMLEYLPLVLVGFFIGLFKALKNEDDEEKEERLLDIVKIFLIEGVNGAILCFICYGLLSLAELPYIFKVCAGALIAYLGMDKAMDLIDRFLNIRKR